MEDKREQAMVLKNKKHKHRHQPTLKQIKALQYINMGMSKRQALLKAGYSIEVAGHPGRAFIHKTGVKKMLNSMAMELADEGLTTQYMVNKFKEWMEAQKVEHSPVAPDKEVPDYQVQLKAYGEWKKIVDQHQAENNPANGQLKRRLTIDEFVTGKEKGGGEDVIVGDTD